MRSAVVIAVGVALLPVAIGGFTLASELPHFSDPCYRWGHEAGESLSPGGDCPGLEATSETRAEAVARLLVFAVAFPLVAVLGAVGIARRRDGAFALGVVGMLAYAIPLGVSRLWLVPLVVAVGLVFARRLEGEPGGTWGRVLRGVGVLAGVGALVALGSLGVVVLEGGWVVVPFTVTSGVLWGLVAAFAWLPQEHFEGGLAVTDPRPGT